MAPARVRVGVTNYTRDLRAFGDWASHAEEAGFELLAYGDSQSLWADSFVALAVAASRTHRVRFGPMVANPVTRHPTVLASGMASLQQLSDGRAVCGVGSGDSALLSIGARPADLAELEQYARAVRGLCAGERVRYRDVDLAMAWETTRVPVWLAAGGPRTLELAGRVADGVVLGNGIDEAVVRDSVARIRHAATAAGRRFEDIELWWLVKPWLADTEEEGWDYLAWTLAGSGNHTFRAGVEGKFVPPELVEPLRRLGDGYRVDQHGTLGGQGGDNAALVHELGLAEFLGRRFSVCGPPTRVVERLREAASYGVGNVIFTLQAPDQAAFMRRLSETVLAEL